MFWVCCFSPAFMDMGIDLLHCSSLVLMIVGDYKLTLVLWLEWKLFLILDLHLSPERDMDSAPIILLEQHMFSDAIP
jgi:hypothetical protein